MELVEILTVIHAIVFNFLVNKLAGTYMENAIYIIRQSCIIKKQRKLH